MENQYKEVVKEQLKRILSTRSFGLDYQSSEGNGVFIYDMTTFGPLIKFGFRF